MTRRPFRLILGALSALLPLSLAVPAADAAPAAQPVRPTAAAKTLTGYWQDFDNGAKPLKLADVPDSYDIIAVAFANADASKPGAVTFGVDSGLAGKLGGYTDDDFKADVKALHGKGKKVVVSVGGQNGTISVGDSTSADNFAGSVAGLIKDYGFDGVDIDLENGINPEFMGQALHKIASSGGSVITMAPQTIDMLNPDSSYFKLALNIKDVLTIVNTQYYNSGTMNGCDGKVYAQGTEDFLTALACTAVQGGLAPQQVGLGLPATQQAAGGGYQDPANVNKALDCLAGGNNCGSFKPSKPVGQLGGAMTWSINWDAGNNYQFAHTVKGG